MKWNEFKTEVENAMAKIEGSDNFDIETIEVYAPATKDSLVIAFDSKKKKIIIEAEGT